MFVVLEPYEFWLVGFAIEINALKSYLDVESGINPNIVTFILNACAKTDV